MPCVQAGPDVPEIQDAFVVASVGGLTVDAQSDHTGSQHNG